MMQNILSKCLLELEKQESDLSYIRGMIEVLLAMQPVFPMSMLPVVPKIIPPEILSEAGILDSKARAALETIKSLSEKSTEI